MKKNWLLIGGVVILLVAAVFMVNSANRPATTAKSTTTAANPSTPVDNHSHGQDGAKTIPAFLAVPPSKTSLAPTLDPANFTGITRDAYRAVREIPVTIAQLPCYCHCDKGFGHKSLYSCFEDDHASHCDVCVREALLALQLQKEQKMTPEQIREAIIEKYSH
jgi:Protein of unknown function with PCYCGC motif